MYYFLTIRKTRKPVLISDYDEIVQRILMDNELGVEYFYEDEKGLHLHLLIQSEPNRKLYATWAWRVIEQKRGWHLDFKELAPGHYVEVRKYIRKAARGELDLIDLEMQFKRNVAYEDDLIHDEYLGLCDDVPPDTNVQTLSEALFDKV